MLLPCLRFLLSSSRRFSSNQRSRTILSVRPPTNFATSTHVLQVSTHERNRSSSAAVHVRRGVCVSPSGILARRPTHRSRHCWPVRPGIRTSTRFQSHPYSATAARSAASSVALHFPCTSVDDLSRACRCWHSDAYVGRSPNWRATAGHSGPCCWTAASSSASSSLVHAITGRTPC